MKNGRCIAIDASCKQFDTRLEQCVSCFSEFYLNSLATCVAYIPNVPITVDPLPKLYLATKVD